jgi:hypothetical protein
MNKSKTKQTKSNIYFMAANDSKYNNNVVGGTYHLKSKDIPAGSLLVLLFQDRNDEWYTNTIRMTIGRPYEDSNFKNHNSTATFGYAVPTRVIAECSTPIYIKPIAKQHNAKHGTYILNPNIPLNSGDNLIGNKKAMYEVYKSILAEITENK